MQKKRPLSTCLTLSVFLLSLTACQISAFQNTILDVVEEKREGGGTTRFYSCDKEKAWDVAKQVFQKFRCTNLKEFSEKGYILAELERTDMNHGCFSGVWFDQSDDDRTGVTVVTMRRTPTTLSTPLSESEFHEEFNKLLSEQTD